VVVVPFDAPVTLAPVEVDEVDDFVEVDLEVDLEVDSEVLVAEPVAEVTVATLAVVAALVTVVAAEPEATEEEEDEPAPAKTSTAAVSEELTLSVQNPAPVFKELLKAPTCPSVQQNPLPWLFLYRSQVGSAQDCVDAPSIAPMQLEEVGQQAAATA